MIVCVCACVMCVCVCVYCRVAGRGSSVGRGVVGGIHFLGFCVLAIHGIALGNGGPTRHVYRGRWMYEHVTSDNVNEPRNV
jgi:hypothetical protein